MVFVAYEARHTRREMAMLCPVDVVFCEIRIRITCRSDCFALTEGEDTIVLKLDRKRWDEDSVISSIAPMMNV